ncbi:MAG: phosphomannomutase [Proteobacteria bacterium]|nr:phosphomannomutase [Pseudomonadota bacterium]MBS0572185.1 phosphomannomutase [Pseudomonadota bacterium]
MAPKFGTSGLRGLVSELTDDLCARYTQAFLRAVGSCGSLCLGRDLRPSSPRIAAAVARAARAVGVEVIDMGEVPTPALAMAALARAAPAVMVTGSHIPADRNGLKFYSPGGEITKEDEAEITRLAATTGADASKAAAIRTDRRAAADYLARYVDFFGPTALASLRIGVYQHSTVARDLLCDLVSALGGHALALGRSDRFIPVDTEAVDDGTRGLLRDWTAAHGLDAIISADGDADRPLLADRAGEVIAGDVLGHLTACALGADTVVTPVSSNTLIERSGVFARVLRTRIGSPHVIAGLQSVMSGPARAVGFEANGGFLLGFAAERQGRRLAPLLTRDACLPLVAPIVAAREAGQDLAALVAALPARVTAADRLEGVPTERSQALVRVLAESATERAGFFAGYGPEAGIDTTDGLRVTFASGLILHLRPSGNAPELRVYAEADSAPAAQAALRDGLARARART